jgi:hypothetical protein
LHADEPCGIRAGVAIVPDFSKPVGRAQVRRWIPIFRCSPGGMCNFEFGLIIVFGQYCWDPAIV